MSKRRKVSGDGAAAPIRLNKGQLPAWILERGKRFADFGKGGNGKAPSSNANEPQPTSLRVREAGNQKGREQDVPSQTLSDPFSGFSRNKILDGPRDSAAAARLRTNGAAPSASWPDSLRTGWQMRADPGSRGFE